MKDKTVPPDHDQESDQQIIFRVREGIYIEGSLYGNKIDITVDTGASRTVVSKKVFEQARATNPKVKATESRIKILQANGQLIPEVLRSRLDLQIGDATYSKDYLITDIDDDILLGMDILQPTGGREADIMLSEGILRLGNNLVPISGYEPRARQVRIKHTVEVDPFSEHIVEVDISGRTGTIVMVEGQKNNFTVDEEETQQFFAVSKTLVDDSHKKIYVRILNPCNTSCSINQGTVIASAYEVELIDTLLEEENPNERDNFDHVRRIQYSESDPGETRPSDLTTDIPLHLKEMFQKATLNCTPDEGEELKQLLCKYSEIFSKDSDDIGQVDLISHEIMIPDGVAPINLPPRRLPLGQLEKEKEAVDSLLRKGVIRPSASPWSSPLVLVKKKNTSEIRTCVDFRRVNEVTIKQTYPLPRIDDCLDALKGASIFTVCDLTSGYYQVPVKEEDIPKTAFSTARRGKFEFTKMPMGLTCAGATFQRLMEIVLAELQWTICLVYLDDIIVPATNPRQLIQRMDTVFQRIQQSGMKMKPSKCELMQTTVTFLGHLVNADGIKPDPCNVLKIQEMSPPENLKQVRRFLGMCGYYRRMIKDYSKRARPLFNLLKGDQEFEWTKSQQSAFEDLKQVLVSPEIMSIPRDEGLFILDTDASGDGIGAVLQQEQDGQVKVIAYGSRTLNKSEKNYCVTDKELLSLRYFVEYYRHYLLGRKFLVRTDHQALKWLMSLKNPKERIARWQEILTMFDFDIEYRAGKHNDNADMMSRIPLSDLCTCDDVDMDEYLKCGPCSKCRKRSSTMKVEQTEVAKAVLTRGQKRKLAAQLEENDDNQIADDMETQAPSKETIVDQQTPDNKRTYPTTMMPEVHDMWESEAFIKTQKNDPVIGNVIKWLKKQERPNRTEVQGESPELRHYWNMFDELEIINDRVYRSNVKHRRKQLLIPEVKRDEVMTHYHNKKSTGGHLGFEKTKQKVKHNFYWFNMNKDVKLWTETCHECIMNKRPNRNPRAPMGTYIVGAPLDRVCTDFLGRLPTTERGNEVILLITDSFTKMVKIIPTKDQTAETTAKHIYDFCLDWGVPLEIHSDQGRNYESQIVQQLCQLLEVRKTRTTARNPKCNGQAERFNKTLWAMIRCYIKHQKADWDIHLKDLESAYNATPHEATGFAPFYLMTGRDRRTSLEAEYGIVMQQPQSYGEYIQEVARRSAEAHQVAREHLKQRVARNKRNYDTKQFIHRFKEGDLVLMFNQQRKIQVSPKLQPVFIGPFVVKKKISDLNYLIQVGLLKERIVHHDKLIPYRGTKAPVWLRRTL